MTDIDRSQVVAALDEVWDALVALATELEAEDWQRPTALPGWVVKDTYSHILGVEAMLLGTPVPEVALPASLGHVHNEQGRVNELWVQQYRRQSAAELLADLGEVLVARRAALARMDQAVFDQPSWTPAGDDTYGRFMRIRVMDQWFHEQDVREATGRPGHLSGLAPEAALTEVLQHIGYAVGKKAGAPPGTSVRFVLTGPIAGRVDVDVTDRARVVDRLPGPPTATIVLPGDRFLRIAGGRVPPGEAARPPAEISGDAALGAKILEGMPYMP